LTLCSKLTISKTNAKPHSRSKPVGLIRSLAQLLGCTPQNVVIVALANKLVRMAWAVLCKNERYRAPVLAVTT
jgi:hypothetical protein